MGKFNNKLTEAELERLAMLAEEAGEVVHIIGKIIRHGYKSYNPLDPEHIPNRRLLEIELGDLTYIKYLMIERGDLDAGNISLAQQNKEEHISPYLHHQ